eukprot:TRINITY_DN13426_c0_g3_i1.p1 TRINITY_DN13426_c0_g3~~TRINITY_DN13426_c0_g3_i1.p1  ORF type:complete len:191 (+),score=54.54 TRINITY_DN13426_c0_g3_i1:58-573(+)
MFKALDFRKHSGTKTTPGHVPKLNLSNIASSKKRANGGQKQVASARKKREMSVSVSPRVDKERLRMAVKKTPRMEVLQDDTTTTDSEVSTLQSQLSSCSNENEKLLEQLEATKATNEFLTDKVRKLESHHSRAKSDWAEERIKLQQTILKLQQAVADSADSSPSFMSGLMG